MKKSPALTWDLDSIFPGGSESEAFKAFLDRIDNHIAALRPRAVELESLAGPGLAEPLTLVVLGLQDLSAAVREAGAFAHCLVAQDADDRKAPILRAKVQQLNAEYRGLWALVDAAVLKLDDGSWHEMLATPPLKELREPLDEHRELAKRKLDPHVEALVGELEVDGYAAWGALYNHVITSIEIPFERDGKEVKLSMGQAHNLSTNDPDRAVRERVFRSIQDALIGNAELCAKALNHLGGFRLTVYRHRGWDSVLADPVDRCRITRETLDAMWAAIRARRAPLKGYLERKARLLGLEKLCIFDVNAPVGRLSSRWPYERAAEFIALQFGRFSPRMADFARRAFENRWIEAEDRPKKGVGGFCTRFPLSGESRIFMTYDNSIKSAATLAHELGHAIHHHAFSDMPHLKSAYPMNLAETASTLAEVIVADAGLKAASDDEERLALLDAKARDAVAYLMNCLGRYEFELAFYRERAVGLAPVERLCELMLEAQVEAYDGALSEYDPYLWASRPHFYNTAVPFYNFPYTFGYLFSHSVYRWALEDANGFERRYEAFLRDTGYMRVEALARKHFGEDITDIAFWERAVDRALDGVHAFLEFTDGRGA